LPKNDLNRKMIEFNTFSNIGRIMLAIWAN